MQLEANESLEELVRHDSLASQPQPWRCQPTAASNKLAANGGILITMHSLSQGGGDRVGALLANGFAAAGIPTRLAVMTDAGEGERELRSLLDPDVQLLNGGPPMGFTISSAMPPIGHQHLERFRGLAFIRRQIDLLQPAVVLASTDNMAFVTALCRTGCAANIVFAMKLTNALFRPSAGRLRRAYRRKLFDFIFARNDVVLTLAEAERQYLAGLYPRHARRFQTVPNPYVSTKMTSASRAGANDPPRILAIGRMVPQKRMDLLLNAFAGCASETATLTILGDGPLRPALAALARSLGIADRLHLPGFVEDIVPWLEASDLLVLSSDYEGLPAVLIEGLACGVPVVATDSFLAARGLLGGLPGCVVVEAGDAAALCGGIDRALATSVESASKLRSAAMPYGISESVTAHIEVLARAFEQKGSNHGQISTFTGWRNIAPAVASERPTADQSEWDRRWAFIVGAPRCGTTSLSQYLANHPDTCFSVPKELHFFSGADLRRLPLNELRDVVRETYLERFFPGRHEHSLLAEGSVSYLYFPELLEPVLKLWPRAKFIICLRNPLELVPSLHQRLFYNGDETEREFERAWALVPERRNGMHIPRSCVEPRFLDYWEAGSLGKHLDRFFDLIGRERCLISVFDDFRSDPGREYSRVLDFLGLDHDHRSEFEVHAESKACRFACVHRILKRPPSAAAWLFDREDLMLRVEQGLTKPNPVLRRILGLRERILNWNKVPAGKPRIAPGVLAEMRAIYREDVAHLSLLIERDLTHWMDS